MQNRRLQIECVDKITPAFAKPKRIKIIVGGRGSTKSTAVADYVASQMASGRLWCCAREHQNSIEESVHRTLLDEIDRLGLPGFTDTKTSITHASGGRSFYKGLARNPTSLKSTLSGVDGLWIEEGEDLSKATLLVLTASVRLNAKDTERKLKGEDVKMPEIIITMNRGARTGAVAQKWLARAEKELDRCGYYEDDLVMIIEVNYTDMPASWFEMSGLESERKDDEENMPRSLYDHKWHGRYLETIDNAIILPEWFDAAVDAHKIERLREAFTPRGAIVAAHDPSDSGPDDKGYAARHGSIIKRVLANPEGEIDDGCEWAIEQAIKDKADMFVWDGDGPGVGLKRQVQTGFEGKKISHHMFRGSLSGKAQDHADDIYMETGNDTVLRTYAETFYNNRAQYYWVLARRFYNTYRCVVKGAYVPPEEMISIDSKGVPAMQLLKSELCRIPRKPVNTGLIQILSKPDMARLGIESPNMADSVMMSLCGPDEAEEDWFTQDLPDHDGFRI